MYSICTLIFSRTLFLKFYKARWSYALLLFLKPLLLNYMQCICALSLCAPLTVNLVSPIYRLTRISTSVTECIQLTLEPESQFYADPVIVLDFQSLYPSIMIAYNYCFSTCLGNISELEKAGWVIALCAMGAPVHHMFCGLSVYYIYCMVHSEL